MAGMNAWLAAALALLPPLMAAAGLALRANTGNLLVAVQFATTLAIEIVIALAMAAAQPSFLDLALALALVGYPGTLIYTHFFERWL
jgi:multisubunit Na+/H+ antiporter MnhF subunit